MRWTITSGRLPRRAQAWPLPAAGLRHPFFWSPVRPWALACGRGELGAVRRVRHAAGCHPYGQHSPALQRDHRQITEEKSQRGADIEEEELHDTISIGH